MIVQREIAVVMAAEIERVGKKKLRTQISETASDTTWIIEVGQGTYPFKELALVCIEIRRDRMTVDCPFKRPPHRIHQQFNEETVSLETADPMKVARAVAKAALTVIKAANDLRAGLRGLK
ncbi:MAG: hypothetical protein Q8K86_09605 [Candidatus Nanopelagicaceae bacterium]|nr:hypothetical protein [Candidatus Nanopelagicaceae bacterium]